MMTKSTRLSVLVPFIGIISLVGMPSLSADIYKSVDKNGVVTFSDTPPKAKSASDERIKLPAHTNRMPSIEVPERLVSENSEAPANPSILTITAPLDNATIPMGPGIFDVLADVQPPLKEAEFVELHLDSTPVAPPPKNSQVDTHLRNARGTQARGSTRVLIGTGFGFISTHNHIRFTTFSTLRSA
ncbi:DUF4124 domain-containing protein [Luminiphilus sp.]|nr:DUF4124 domain-containing protein [Luminiphilus sp.]